MAKNQSKGSGSAMNYTSECRNGNLKDFGEGRLNVLCKMSRPTKQKHLRFRAGGFDGTGLSWCSGGSSSVSPVPRSANLAVQAL